MSRNSYYVFFSKLSTPLRINIILELYEKPKSVNQISKELNTEQSKISHALKELRECNIIDFKQKGKRRIYSLSKTIIPILKLIDKHGKKYCLECKGCEWKK